MNTRDQSSVRVVPRLPDDDLGNDTVADVVRDRLAVDVPLDVRGRLDSDDVLAVDDVLGEDPTVNRLEARAAEMGLPGVCPQQCFYFIFGKK